MLLLWPAIVNRQPFFFPDTTSYVRAADLAVRLVTHGRVQSAWSVNDPSPADLPKGAAPAPRQVHGSDGREGGAGDLLGGDLAAPDGVCDGGNGAVEPGGHGHSSITAGTANPSCEVRGASRSARS